MAKVVGSGGVATTGLRRSSRTKSNWTPFPKEDCCARRRSLGGLSHPAGLQALPTQGCYCPEECTGVDNKGCTNRAPVFTSLQCLRAKQDIPAGTFMTLFGGVTLQARTQKEAYDSLNKILTHHHDTDGEGKFQYSVLVGSEQNEGSLAWMVSVNDFRVLHRLLGKKTRANKPDRELKSLTEEGRASLGLGQYAQHTCCGTHSNVHLFPIFVYKRRR
jgi:hypothetical protein